MLENLKKTIKHTAVYSLGNIAVKLVGVVLLPLYTKHITVTEYGILGILEITIMILTETLILGQPNAFLRFHDASEFTEKRKSTLFTIFIFLLTIGGCVTLMGEQFAPQIASYFSKPQEFTLYFRLSFVIVFLRVLNNLYLTVLRAKEKSVLFATGNIFKIIVILSLNIYFVAYIQIGVSGILYAFLIGDGFLFILLSPLMIKEMSPNFDQKILKVALAFGLPLIFTSLAGMILNMGDRYILKLLVNYREVGLYSLGYKIAGLINIFLVKSFSLGFLPLAFKMYGKEGDKRYYSKMQTYLVFVLVWAGLALSLFTKDLVEKFALDNSYWSAYKVIPVIILTYIIIGAKSVSGLGILLKKKTKYLAVSTIFATLLNIGLNFLLIPSYKMMGAAYATLISFIVLYLIVYYISDHFYPIPFENSKLIKMLLLGVGLYLISLLFVSWVFWYQFLAKIFILLLFPFILYFLRFYEEIEIQRIKEQAQRIIRFVL